MTILPSITIFSFAFRVSTSTLLSLFKRTQIGNGIVAGRDSPGKRQIVTAQKEAPGIMPFPLSRVIAGLLVTGLTTTSSSRGMR